MCFFCLPKKKKKNVSVSTGTAYPSRSFHADLGELASISVLPIPYRSELLFLGTDDYVVLV